MHRIYLMEDDREYLLFYYYFLTVKAATISAYEGHRRS